MVSKKYWDKIVTEFVNLVKQVKKEESVEILGAPFQVLPGVFSPVYSSDTIWFAQKIIPLIKGKKFLEIGSGTGAIACLASMNGALQVVATDINPIAIDNIHLNAKSHLLNISIREGNVFDPIEKNELFDIIFWNHPFNYADKQFPETDMLTNSVFDNKYKALDEFIKKGKNHLTKNGILILGSSNIARIKMIKKMATDEGYKLNLLEKIEVPAYKEKRPKIDLRIYTLKTI